MKPYYNHAGITIYHGNALEVLKSMEAESVQCCVTSPPYWGLRDYGVENQLGLEKTPEEYVVKMVEIFSKIKHVLKNDGVLWLNLGDSYAGSNQGFGTKNMTKKQASNKGTVVLTQKKSLLADVHGLKPKDLCGIPWRIAFALQADGWYLRSDIIWQKPNPMPESVTDRPTKAHEYIFLLTKSSKYFYDADAIKEPQITSLNDKAHHSFGTPGGKVEQTPGKNRKESGKKWDNKGIGRNKRSVWTIATKPYKEAHFATFPPEIPRICILAGSKVGDVILDPFGGAMTTLMVAQQLNRKATGIELNEDYIKIGMRRLQQEYLPFG